MQTFLFLYPDEPTRKVIDKSRQWLEEHEIDVLFGETDTVFKSDIHLPNYTQVDAVVDTVLSCNFDGLIVQTEYALLPGAVLCHKLAMPGISLDAAMLCTNKWMCREVLAQNKIPGPHYMLAETSSQVRHFGHFPVVLKGIATTLGRNVTIVKAASELDDKVSELKAQLSQSPDIRRLLSFAKLTGFELDCDPLRQFLVEEYVAGCQYETDGLLYGKLLDCFGVTEPVITQSPRVFFEGYMFPADVKPDLEPLSAAAIQAIQLADAGFSIEFRDDKLIEINARLGEDNGFPDLFKVARGQYAIIDWLTYLSGDMPPLRSIRSYAALGYANFYQRGIVREIPNADHNFEIVVRPGQHIFTPPYPEVNPHLAFAIATHESSSRSAYMYARKKVDALRFAIDLIADEAVS